MTKRKRKVLLGSTLSLAVLLGGSLLWIGTSYQPLLFAVGNEVVRTDDWQKLKPIVFNGIPDYTREEELQKLEQRSKEELVLAMARKMGVAADEALIEKQISQLGATPEEREAQIRETGLTEDQIRTNYRRALTAFALKAQMTQDVKISEQEVSDFYHANLQEYYAPEYRSIHYLRAQQNDIMLDGLLKDVTPDNFPDKIRTLHNEGQKRIGSYEELASQGQFEGELTANIAAEMFKAPLNQIVGPIQDGEYKVWCLITDRTDPKQFSLDEVRNKISTIMLQEKQIAKYRTWIDAQQSSVGYLYRPENFNDESRLAAFWRDLPDNFHLLLQKFT